MGLRMNYEGIIQELLKNLEHELRYALEAWKNEVLNGMQHPYFKKNGIAEYIIKNDSNTIIAYLKVNTYVLADAYGTGSLMLTNENPGFKDFKNKYWHSARNQGTAITGRRTGNYTDVFGKEHHTSGNFAGKNIEHQLVNPKSNKEPPTPYYIEPAPPSRTIEHAEKWLYNTYLPRAYENAVKRLNFSKFLIEY